VSPIFFGILIALNLQTSFLSPPVAMAAFYLKGVAPPHVKLEDIFKGCMPFIYIVIFCMIMVYVFPGLVTWLPELLYSHAPADPGSAALIDSPPVGGFQEVEEISLPPLN
jgi:TRAP-type mannitol/chloroaromatic compound transport system permease large subunit